MTVASGQLPYSYNISTPIRGLTGMSGELIESAQFVLQAEMRKFNTSDTYTTQWNVYTNENDSPLGSGYDPKANGDTLNGLVGPQVQIDLDHIPLMRIAMVEGLFNSYEDFCDYDNGDILEDWIRQTYPISPSGYRFNGTSANFRGTFLRPVLQADGSTYLVSIFSANGQTGSFEDTDIHWFGGSGALYDIDIGEVMWNPYPMSVLRGIGDAHGTSDNWTIQVRPLYPAFQKTDGSIISLNGFEFPWIEDPVTSDFTRNIAHVDSGVVRFNSYPVFGDSDIVFGRMNDLEGDTGGMVTSTNIASVAAESARNLGGADGNVVGSEVFFTPIPLGTGVYRVAARNTKSNFPNTTIESGVVSQWPKPRNITSNIGNVLSNYYGYEVFDSCFWVTDIGTTGSFAPAGASGLAVVSPFTGKSLWTRQATTASAGTTSIDDVSWYKNTIGLQRVGTDDIKRIADSIKSGTGVPAMGPPTGVIMQIDLATYNDDLSTVTVTNITPEGPVFGTAASNIVIRDLLFDGTSYFIVFSNSSFGTPPWICELDVSFAQTARYDFSSTSDRLTKLGYVSDGMGGAKRYVTFSRTNNTFLTGRLGIRPITLASPPTFGTEKVIDFSTHIVGTEVQAEIYELIELSGETELDDGVYALFSLDTSVTTNRLYIARIQEESTSWSIQGLWIITSVSNSWRPFLGNMSMIYMPVN